LNESCPQCGTARVGAFRFCRGCGLDFDALGPIDRGPAAEASPTQVTPVAWVTPVPAAPTARRVTRRRVLLGGVAVLVGVMAIGSLPPTDPGSPVAAVASATPTPQVDATATPTSTGELVPSPRSTFGPTGPTIEATVVRVVDGDTIVVAYGGDEYKVRYIGMDAPETKDPNSPVEFMGPQATTANTALVKGKTVFLEKDVSEVDQYDRLLRYVWVNDGIVWTLVNRELVRQGLAIARSYPPDVRYDDLYRAAATDAQLSGLGMYAATPTPAPTATPKPTAKPTAKPTPKPTAKPKPASKCHPSYDPCLPIVDDLNCPEVRAMGKAPVDVIGPDDYGLDRDHDGLGCESG
jgi:micrococcal nuclease